MPPLPDEAIEKKNIVADEIIEKKKMAADEIIESKKVAADEIIEKKNIAADEIIESKKVDIVSNLQKQLSDLENNIVELSERRRGWVRSGITFWFCCLITYVVVKYTGIADGQIRPETIWSFGTGVFVTKILDHYINPMTKKDRVL